MLERGNKFANLANTMLVVPGHGILIVTEIGIVGRWVQDKENVEAHVVTENKKQ